MRAFGGVAVQIARVIKCLNKLIAQKLDTPETEVATQFWHRLGIDIQRSGHRAFIRRVGQPVDLEGARLGRAFGEVGLLEVPGEL